MTKPNSGSSSAPRRLTGRHPKATGVVVRLTDPAIEDLERIRRKVDPQILRSVFKKFLLLEENPEAGAPLRGSLIGFRKLVVGDRTWRLVWRVTYEESGAIVIDVAEVWAVGARSDSEVYDEMRERVRSIGDTPHTVPLAEAVAAFGALGGAPSVAPEATDGGPPAWLTAVLGSVLGMPPGEIAKLDGAQAQRVWDDYISGGGPR